MNYRKRCSLKYLRVSYMRKTDSGMEKRGEKILWKKKNQKKKIATSTWLLMWTNAWIDKHFISVSWSKQIQYFNSMDMKNKLPKNHLWQEKSRNSGYATLLLQQLPNCIRMWLIKAFDSNNRGQVLRLFNPFSS